MKICGIKKFDSIYEEHYEKVFVAALGYMRDRYLAEEIFQETFLELYMRIDTVHSETAENWLLTVVKHKSINMLKYVATRQEQIGYFETDPDEIPSDSYGNIQRIEEQRDCNNLSRKIFDELYQENVTWYKAIVRESLLFWKIPKRGGRRDGNEYGKISFHAISGKRLDKETLWKAV